MNLLQYARPDQLGAAFEDMLNQQHSFYRSNERAYIWHNGVQGKIHRGKAVLMKSHQDYGGILTCRGGQFVGFEAKSIQGNTYHHPKNRLHQLQRLWEIHESGGVAFLFLAVQLTQFFIVWPQPSWATLKPFTLRVTANDERMTEVPVAGYSELPDWLTTLEACL